MTGPVLLAAAGLIVLVVLGYATWTLVIAARYRARHEQREQAGEAEADEFVAELRGLPAPGLDYISDRNVRLPWTPPLARAERLATDTDIRSIELEPEIESTFVRALLAAVPDPARIDAVFAGRR